MKGILELPDLGETQEIQDQSAFNLAVWEQISKNQALQEVAERIETNAYGQIVMSPPPSFDHGLKQSALVILLSKISSGNVVTECPLSTSDGVKAIDAAWISDERQAEQADASVLTIAPEICVEVISPSNSKSEMKQKKALYFGAGAQEVWFCQRDGRLTLFHFQNPERETEQSQFHENLPESIS